MNWVKQANAATKVWQENNESWSEEDESDYRFLIDFEEVLKKTKDCDDHKRTYLLGRLKKNLDNAFTYAVKVSPSLVKKCREYKDQSPEFFI